MGEQSWTGWGTESELNFLRGLGTGKHASPPHASRVELLQSYLESMRLRVNWGAIETDKIFAYLSYEIVRAG